MNQKTLEKALADLPFEKIAYFESVGSTNDIVAEWARSGKKGFCLAIANEQRQGRGRSGRRWYTLPGSALAFSLLLPNTCLNDKENIGRATGLGALVVCEAIEKLFGLTPEIKWPNDVLINKKKVSGVLSEAHWSGEKLQALILGIGINVAPSSLPSKEALNFPATSLERAVGKPVERLGLLKTVLESLVDWTKHLEDDDFIAAWEGRLAFQGQAVSLEEGNGEMTFGHVQGLAPSGGLKLRLDSGEIRSYQIGEIRLRPLVDSGDK